jgi:hypothetical protein
VAQPACGPGGARQTYAADRPNGRGGHRSGREQDGQLRSQAGSSAHRLGGHCANCSRSASFFVMDHHERTPGRVSFSNQGLSAVSAEPKTPEAMAQDMLRLRTPIRFASRAAGGGGSLEDLLIGRADVCLCGLPEVLPHVASGAVRIIAVSSPARSLRPMQNCSFECVSGEPALPQCPRFDRSWPRRRQ